MTNNDLRILVAAAFILLPASVSRVWAGSGTDGSAFLSIPVGAGPAALGSAYSALATDAYAPVWNPAGLGQVDSVQLAGQHLSYLESIHYEYLSTVMPLDRQSGARSGQAALGFSAQYLGSGDINGTDVSGAPTGSFSNHYGAYTLSYGRALTEKLSLGLSGKWINAQLDDVTANAYAADLGSLYRVTDKLHLAATLTNLGTPLKFLSNGDSLPLAGHLAAAYAPSTRWLLTTEGVFPQTGLASFHVGGQWRPIEIISLRAGYRTDTLKENTALAGFSTGMGLELWGQEFAYAWVPYGDLGDTQYFSLLIKFGEAANAKRNLIQYQAIKSYRAGKAGDIEPSDVEYQQLMELLSRQDMDLARGVSR